MRRAAAVALAPALALAAALAATPGAVLPLLTADGLAEWEERRFAGRTVYALEPGAHGPVLRAEARGGASGLYRERTVDLVEWPVLRWAWRVEALPPAGDPRLREGDDYAARVYAVWRHPLMFWRSRAVCYVWAATAMPGESWPNPFTENVRMLVLRGAGDPAGEWRTERRDVAEDFRQLFGEAPTRLDAVAIMTDSDQSGALARAAYRDLRFESRGPTRE